MSENNNNKMILLDTTNFLLGLVDKLLPDEDIDYSWMEIIWEWAEENNITDIRRGISPDNRDQEYLSNLEELNITEKQLYHLPKAIGKLTNLVSFGIGGNVLESLPSEIGNLAKLEKLFLWNNKLKELPEEIVSLTCLRQFYIQDNPLLILNENQKNWIGYLDHLGCDIRMDEDLLEREHISLKDNKVEKNELNTKIQMNFMSNMFGGLLIDIHNFDYFEIRGTTLFLITKHIESILVYKYENSVEAEEDKEFYESVISNPDAAVILVEDRGLLKVYGEESSEYRELCRGFWYGFNENEEEVDINYVELNV